MSRLLTRLSGTKKLDGVRPTLGPTPIKGVGYPFGYSRFVDASGHALEDIVGGEMIGQAAAPFSLIKDSAARRGIQFGSALKLSLQGNDTHTALIQQQTNMLVFESNAFAPKFTEPSPGVYNFTEADAAATWAQQMGKPMRLHLLHYPAHDMPWSSTNDGSTITPVLDGSGNPIVNSTNAEALLRNKVDAYAARWWSESVKSIDVSNELADGNQTDGWRRHPWYDALGPNFLLILFEQARLRWPNTELCLCQDLMEQTLPGYDIRGAFLKIIDFLLANNAPIDAVALQGHLTFARGWDAAGFRAFLEAIKGRGLKIKLTEIDIRTGNTGAFTPANYTNIAFDQTAAEMISQYLSIALPFVDGGEVLVWGLSDANNSWGGPSERTCLYDGSYQLKPVFYNSFLETMCWS